MKNAILCLLMLVSIAAIAQDKHSIVSEETSNSIKIDKLQKAVVRIENEIQNKTDSLAILREEIKHLDNQEKLSKFKQETGEFSCLTTLRMKGDMQVSPNTWDETIAYFDKGDTINVTEFTNGYWKANKDEFVGYVSDIFLTQTEELKCIKSRFRKAKIQKCKKKKHLIKEIEAAKNGSDSKL
jgi:hypothetical protein